MGRPAILLANGTPRTETHPPHPARRIAGGDDKLEAWSRRILGILRDLDTSKRRAGETGQLQPLTNSLVELASIVGADAPLSRWLDDPPQSTQHAPETSAGVQIETRGAPAVSPDTRRAFLYRGTATTLVADVEDASETPGDDVTRWARFAFQKQVASHGGVELDAPGTPLAAAFSSPREALLCAISVQRTMAGRAAEHPAEPMRVRIALHTEEGAPEGSDRLAETTLVASRIATQACGGEILVSSRLREVAESDLRFGHGRTVDIEGFGGSSIVYEVCWAGAVAAPLAGRGVFRRDRDHWTIAWRGGRCLLRDLRGLSYVAQLLRQPGREFHALDLVGARRSNPSEPSLGLEAFDDHVRANYRRQLDDVREDIQEAERLCDLGRAARAREEREILEGRLAAAVGLEGCDPRAAAAAERARCTVAQGIRVALKRIHRGLPALAGELRLRIKTGMYCSYVPDQAHPTDWLM